MKASGPMTMQHPDHPQDERLAALAGGDPEVASDAALRAHVDSCDRCTDLVRDLASLRTALAELPDLAPSRPLQLLPPVDEPRTAASAGWLRRLARPAMAAGFVLVVVGAFGTSGISIDMGVSEIFQNVGENLQTRVARAAPSRGRGRGPLGAGHRPRESPVMAWPPEVPARNAPARQKPSPRRPRPLTGASVPFAPADPASAVAGGAWAGGWPAAGGHLPALRAAAARRLNRPRR